MWTAPGWRPSEEVKDGLPDGRHGRLWRWPSDSFFRPAALRRRDWRNAKAIRAWSAGTPRSGRTAPRTRRRARGRLPPHLDGTRPARPVGSPLLPPRAEHRHPRIAGRCRALLWRERHLRPTDNRAQSPCCNPQSGSVRISVCGRAVDHQAAMALMKRSPKITANCAFAMVHSRGGIFHSFSDRFKIR